MKTASRKGVLAVLVVALVCFLTFDFAEAQRRGGGGGRGGGGRSMHRGGAASSGSMQRSRARPQRQSPSRQNNDFSRENRSAQRPEQGQRQERDQQRDQQDRDDRNDQRQDNIDRRNDQIDERQDFAKDVHNERKEWAEDNWRRGGGTYISVSSWNSRSCSYTTIYRNGMTQYSCGGVYYERVYRSGEVVYVVTN